MSTEGVALVTRAAFVLVLIVATAVARTIVGPSKQRGGDMLVGTLGGMAAGVGAAALTSRWIATDLSVILSCLGIFAGWGMAWIFARRIPRNAL